jgi:hypothetical protein
MTSNFASGMMSHRKVGSILQLLAKYEDFCDSYDKAWVSVVAGWQTKDDIKTWVRVLIFFYSMDLSGWCSDRHSPVFIKWTTQLTKLIEPDNMRITVIAIVGYSGLRLWPW